MGRGAFEGIVDAGEGQTGHLRHSAREQVGEPGCAVEAGADGRSPLAEGMDVLEGTGNALPPQINLLREARELLAERERRRILQVSAADLVYAPPFAAFGFKRCLQALQGGQQPAMGFPGGGNVHGARKAVVGGLAAVTVVVGMHGLLAAKRAAEHFTGPVGDDLIGVHVGLGAGTGLPDGEGKVRVPATLHDFLCGRCQRLRNGWFQLAKLAVAACGAVFDDAERVYQGGRHGFAADGEMADGALGLRAPVAVRCHLNVAESVAFNARGVAGFSASRHCSCSLAAVFLSH